jgi:hypothetical protein
MKNKLPRRIIILIFIILLVLIVAVAAVLLIIYNNQQASSGDNSETTQDGSTEDDKPVIDATISILDYRKNIETDCDYITIKISVTNIGELPINYSDITNGTYDFSVVVEDIIAWSSKRGMQVSDFGTIQIGETKEITFTGGHSYDYGGITYHENDFRGPDDNGTYKMKVTLNEPYAENRYVVRGESEAVNITINIYEDPSQNLLKSCEGTL